MAMGLLANPTSSERGNLIMKAFVTAAYLIVALMLVAAALACTAPDDRRVLESGENRNDAGNTTDPYTGPCAPDIGTAAGFIRLTEYGYEYGEQLGYNRAGRGIRTPGVITPTATPIPFKADGFTIWTPMTTPQPFRDRLTFYLLDPYTGERWDGLRSCRPLR